MRAAAEPQVRAETAIVEVADAPPAPGHPREIAPGVLWLRMPLPFALNHVNLWLVAESDGYTLVDCGYGDAATRAHWERHFATSLAARFGCAIAMTQAEFLAAHALIEQQAGFGQADVRALFARHGMAAEH